MRITRVRRASTKLEYASITERKVEGGKQKTVTVKYLGRVKSKDDLERYKRNASESAFSSEKRTTGGLIFHRRKDRIETSGFCKGLIHNLMLLHG